MFIKIGVVLQAAQLIICHPKSKIYENFQTAIPKNKHNMFITILLSFFITYFTNSISELPSSLQAEEYSEPHQRFKILGKWLTVPEAYSERSQTSKMKLFEEKIFSRPLFPPFTILPKKLHLRCSTPFWIRLWNYFRKRLHLISLTGF